jgi:hypothetical protein
MNHTLNLQGKSDSELQALHSHLACEFFGDISETERDEISTTIDTVKNCLPASFVLASLFEVESMTLEVPDHVLESDPSLEWVTCPSCDGDKWLETEGNGWCDALFSDPRRAYAYRALNRAYKVCGRCSGSGEVLDCTSPLEAHHDDYSERTPADVLIARVEHLLAQRRAVKHHEGLQDHWQLAA